MQHKTHKDVQYNAPRFRCWKSKEKIQVKFGWKLKCDWHVKTRFHSDGSISLAGILKKKKQRRNQKHKQNIIGARSNISIQLYIHGLTRLFHVSNHSTCTHSYLFVFLFVFLLFLSLRLISTVWTKSKLNATLIAETGIRNLFRSERK